MLNGEYESYLAGENIAFDSVYCLTQEKKNW